MVQPTPVNPTTYPAAYEAAEIGMCSFCMSMMPQAALSIQNRSYRCKNGAACAVRERKYIARLDLRGFADEVA